MQWKTTYSKVQGFPQSVQEFWAQCLMGSGHHWPLMPSEYGQGFLGVAFLPVCGLGCGMGITCSALTLLLQWEVLWLLDKHQDFFFFFSCNCNPVIIQIGPCNVSFISKLGSTSRFLGILEKAEDLAQLTQILDWPHHFSQEWLPGRSYAFPFGHDTLCVASSPGP